jgi:hypothetical protein
MKAIYISNPTTHSGGGNSGSIQSQYFCSHLLLLCYNSVNISFVQNESLQMKVLYPIQSLDWIVDLI